MIGISLRLQCAAQPCPHLSLVPCDTCKCLCLYCGLSEAVALQQLASSRLIHTLQHNKTFAHSLSLFNPPGPFSFLPSVIQFLSCFSSFPCCIPPFLSLSFPLPLFYSLPLSPLSEVWQVCNWMINDHQRNSPSHRHTLNVKMELYIFMHTHICMRWHTLAYIFLHYTCVHLASIAQMVKFKPVGVLKWWRHYKEWSNTLSAICMILHRASTGLQWSSLEMALLSFIQNVSTYVWIFRNTKSVIHCSTFLKIQPKLYTSDLWSCKDIFSSNDSTQTLTHSAYEHFQARSPICFPLFSSFVNVKADFMQCNSHRLMECWWERRLAIYLNQS